MESRIVAGLDVGSTKTAVVVADVGIEGGVPRIKVLGVGQARTTGLRREVVTDLEATTDSIRRAVKEAELMAGVTLERLYTGIAGEHVHGRASMGLVAVGGKEITGRDIERVQEVARAVVVPTDREVLHAIPQEYIVDAQSGIRDPAGMAGTRLESEVYLVTGSASAGQNLRKAVERAGYQVAELVFEPLASSLAVLSEDEREVGVALVELGGGTTDVTLFHDRKVRYLCSLPWGGATVNNDIVMGLSLPYAEAVRAKETWGTALAAGVDPREVFEVPGAAPGENRQVTRELLAHIIEQRLDEIFGLVAERIEKSGVSDRLSGGVVLTGGGAALAGIRELAERSFTGPVRIGMPGAEIQGLVDSVRAPKLSTATGLVLWGARRISAELVEGSGAAGAPANVIRWVRDWFNDFF
ncbi:MAG: cell division protein FtsA [Gemmatimonadota bacterium]|jgi:cell division protein FtsA|nr:cell division protein FtsA [Gemmatimonadota bacterium]